MFKVENFYVLVEDKEILRGVDFEVNLGEFYVIMGLNGLGKLMLVLMIVGYFKYRVIDGKIFFEGEDIIEFGFDERVKRGILFVF